MKKTIIISIFILITIVCTANIVKASTGSAKLTPSVITSQEDETFTVTLSVNCESKINEVQTTISYDEDKLELISNEVANDNWVNEGEGNSLVIKAKENTDISKDDLYVLKFKTKKVEKDCIAKISTSTIKVISSVNSSNFEDEGRSASINLTVKSNNDTTKKETKNTENKTINSNIIAAGKTENKVDNSAENKTLIVGNKVSNNVANNTSNNVVNSIVNTNNNVANNSNQNVESDSLPKTGMEDTYALLIAIAVVLAFAGYSLYRYTNY